MDERLPKALKLKSKKQIDSLFQSGKTIKSFPLIMVYQSDDALEVPYKVGFSVSKRYFKHAVDRNRIKRLMRENFRKNKYLFHFQQNKPFICMFIYTGKQLPSYDEMGNTLKKIAKKVKANAAPKPN